ncbi:MAG: transcription termination/antitermination protein NusA [Actinobacteria bacterium]|nr:transcription termination/antitermination protein NusA [Actinomycetota bacterium]
MSSELIEALKQIEREKGINSEMILNALETALISAYRKDYGTVPNIRVEIDRKTGEVKVLSSRKSEESDEVIEVEVTPDDFGRIATQTAKQIILQRIREAERDIMYEEYSDRQGDIVTGIVEQTDQRYTLINLGKVEALLPPGEQVVGERYDHGSRLKVYVLEVRRTSKGPQIIVSRSHPGLIKRLFELEVPEVYDGFVEIKSVAREAGYRSKIAVASKDSGVDPVGACVGPKGSRVRMVVNELRGEKIDIVQWSEDPAVFVSNALSPAKVKEVSVDLEKNTASVIVPDFQLSLAIGKEGQNARLAAKLTGWRIDIKSETQAKEGLSAIVSEPDEGESVKEKVADGLSEEIKEKTESSEGQCQAVTSAGHQCKNTAKPGSNYCGVHLRNK